MTEYHKEILDKETSSLLAHGFERVTVAEFYRRYAVAGFRFDRTDNIKQYSRYLTGPRAGESSPIVAMHPIVMATGRSWAHFENDRSIYEAVKALRNSIFAVSRDGYILEV